MLQQENSNDDFGLSFLVHSFKMEILSVVKSFATSVKADKIVNLKWDQMLFRGNFRNQAYALISVSGDILASSNDLFPDEDDEKGEGKDDR